MKEMNRRTFLKLSGASAVMLALAACDDSCSSGSTSSGSATETPPSPPIPVIRDGQKILTIFNAELARRKVENIKFEYSKGLEHAIQADVQMFVDNGSPEFPAEEGQSAAEEILRRAERETDYARKRALYQQALEADENCLEAWKQLAFLGRLGEKGGKPDFSRIPSWPLDCLFQPREYKREQRAEMLRLLLHNAPYLAALAKVPDAAAFRREYLTAMAAQYVDLFLRHNAQISMALFGIRRRSAEVRQRIIAAVAVMRENAAALPEVPEELRAELQAALEEGLNLALEG